MIDAPVPSGVPPQLPLYHTHCAPVPNEPPTTLSVVVPLLHIEIPFELEMDVGSVDGRLTVTLNEHVVVFPDASTAE